jgi:exodeoxyribonuclease-3
MSLKIATWNINSIKMRINHLREYITANQPDIVLLQELKCETEKFPFDELSDLPYNFYVHGQKSYNGVAILSKFRADEIKLDFLNNPAAEQARFIEILTHTSIGYCRIISLYAPNGGEVESVKFELKLQFYDALISYLEQIKNFDEKIIIGGDFNIAPFDIDVYSPSDLANTTCFTNQEKQKIREVFNIGFDDLYRLFHPQKQEFSWWDYRARGFELNKGLRIDFILSSHNASSHFNNCSIDYKTREKIKSSDHAPVMIF